MFIRFSIQMIFAPDGDVYLITLEATQVKVNADPLTPWLPIAVISRKGKSCDTINYILITPKSKSDTMN